MRRVLTYTLAKFRLTATCRSSDGTTPSSPVADRSDRTQALPKAPEPRPSRSRSRRRRTRSSHSRDRTRRGRSRRSRSRKASGNQQGEVAEAFAVPASSSTQGTQEEQQQQEEQRPRSTPLTPLPTRGEINARLRYFYPGVLVPGRQLKPPLPAKQGGGPRLTVPIPKGKIPCSGTGVQSKPLAHLGVNPPPPPIRPKLSSAGYRTQTEGKGN